MSRHVKKIKDIILHKGYNKKDFKFIMTKLEEFKNADVIAIYNPECIGVMNSTLDLFDNTIGIKEIFSDKVAKSIADKIVELNIKQVVFSSIVFGWKKIAEYLRINSDKIKIKFLWHGSHSMFVTRNESYFLYNIIELLDRNIVNAIGFSKESMAEFYNKKGYNSYFVPNNVKSINKIKSYSNDKVSIGLYLAANRWEKNAFNQLSAISMMDNVTVDMIGIDPLVKSFCDMMNIQIKDSSLGYLKREELLKRMAQNDINLYVTFTECSPVVPLESLELGVPCITGNNHHYFKNSKLYDYLVVKSEDDINEIFDKINICINKKDEIIELYKSWKKDYDKFANEKLFDFIKS